MSKEEIKKKLTPLQYKVTQEDGTERAFRNEYWDNKKEGIYVDIVSGEPLFSSKDKFKSGTGWPSFTKPLVIENISEKQDSSLSTKRTEVRSKEGNSHLGHIFNDGPAPTGDRYCINSASLRFVPAEDLDKEGYGKYKHLFDIKQSKSIDSKNETAIFAAGCFWGVEEILSNIKGVISVESGYTGGNTKNPAYEEISAGNTGHAEAVQVKYNPGIVSYEELLNYFWRLHDPTTLNRQGPDKGTQYRSAIFYTNNQQKEAAEKSKEAFDKSKVFKNKAVTRIVPAATFYKAEDYHQDFYKKHSNKPVCHTLRDQ